VAPEAAQAPKKPRPPAPAKPAARGELTRAIINALPATASQISQKIRKPVTSVNSTLSRLTQSGAVTRSGRRGTYVYERIHAATESWAPLTQRQQEMLAFLPADGITRREFAVHFGVGRAQARAVLREFVQRGLVRSVLAAEGPSADVFLPASAYNNGNGNGNGNGSHADSQTRILRALESGPATTRDLTEALRVDSFGEALTAHRIGERASLMYQRGLLDRSDLLQYRGNICLGYLYSKKETVS
jgi:predicted transcriptional regulator